eukprot:18342-Heterococcus_DN1.PRE.4
MQVSGIRDAYQHGDAEASRLLHDLRANEPHEEAHSDYGEYLKGAAGGGLDWPVVLVLGFSNIFADALSMGVGEYLSSQAHNEYVLAEKRREEWELQNHREGEISEMVSHNSIWRSTACRKRCAYMPYPTCHEQVLHAARTQTFELAGVSCDAIDAAVYASTAHQQGMSHEDATDVINKMAKYDDFFVNLMMNEELGLSVPDEKDDTVKEGFLMFLSFAFFGAMPLIGYVVTGLSLFAMGAIKSKFAIRSWYVSGIEMVLLGGCCAAVAYEIGKLVD